MSNNKRLSFLKKVFASICLFFMALVISTVMTPVFLMSDWFDYCSDGKWSESFHDIWKS